MVSLVIAAVCGFLVGVWVSALVLGSQDAPKAKPVARPLLTPSSRLNWMVGIEGSVRGRTYHIGHREALLGRGEHCYIQLADATASREHVQLCGDAQGVRVIDMGGETGTRVNGRRLAPMTPYQLRPGDRLGVGAQVLEFVPIADFARNDGLTQGELTRADARQLTQALTLDAWQQQVRHVVAQTRGDTAEAARRLAVDEQVILEALGVSRGQRPER